MSEIDTLAGVPETLLIPLAARAVAFRRYPRLGFRDTKAEEMAERLDVDFARYAAASSSVKGVILRSQWFDRVCLDFLKAQPQPIFVSLGSGLNTMYERLLANAQGRGFRWIDSDLPDVVAIRRKLLPDDARRTTIEADATKLDWLARIARRQDQPVMIVAEGVLMYFEPAQVATLFRGIADALSGNAAVRFGFDFAGPAMVRNSRNHPAVKRIKDQSVVFKWPMKGPREIAQFDPRWRVGEISSRPMTGVSASMAALWAVYRMTTGYRFYGCALAELKR